MDSYGGDVAAVTAGRGQAWSSGTVTVNSLSFPELALIGQGRLADAEKEDT